MQQKRHNLHSICNKEEDCIMYILPTPNEFGAYSNPQSKKVYGLVYLPDELIEQYINYNGFVFLTIECDTVTALEPNIEAWEAWKAAQPEETDPKPSSNGGTVTWGELDAAYNEGRDNAYEQ
jgi:hypothetical protein